MRLRLPKRLRAFIRRRSTKGLVGLLVASVVLLGLVGGGVYAAFGGFTQTAVTGSIDLQKGLVGWWKLDGNTKDSSPYQNNPTVSGSGIALTADRKSRINAAYAFDGTGDAIQTPVATLAGLPSGVTPKTYAAWIRPSSASNGTVMSLRLSPSGQMRMDVQSGGKVACFGAISTNQLLTLNAWSSVVCTDNGTTVSIYVNGVLAQQLASTGYSGFANRFLIGGAGGSNNFYGSIDDVRVYNRIVNANEAKALNDQYNAQVNLGSGENGLVGWWKFDGNSKDSTPYSNYLSAAGTSNTTDRKGMANSAYQHTATAGLTASDAPSLNMGTSDWTTSAWFKTAGGTGATQVLLSKRTPGYYMTVTDTGLPNACIFPSANHTSPPDVCLLPSVQVADNTWHLMTVTFARSSVMTMYIDGVSVASSSISAAAATNITNAGSFTVGRDAANGGARLVGSIDDVRLYRRALSANDVRYLFQSYNSQISLNSSPTASQATGNVNTGLVGYWPLNGNAKDVTPYQNITTSNTGTVTTDRKGRANSAYDFSSSNSKAIACGTSTALQLANKLSVSAWVYPTTTAASINGVFSMGQGGYWLYTNSTNNPALLIASNATTGSSSLALNTWHHLVGTFDSSLASNNIKLYADGVLVGQSNFTGNINSSEYAGFGFNCTIGNIKSPSNRNFNGTVDDVRIYKRPLNTSEITTLYNNYY